MGKVTTLASSLYKSALFIQHRQEILLLSTASRPALEVQPSSLHRNVSGSFPDSKFAFYRSG